MLYSDIRLNSLNTITKLVDAIESLQNEPRNVVGGLKQWNSGYATELLLSAQRKLDAMEKKLEKLEAKQEALLETGSWCYSEPDHSISPDDKQTLQPWLIIADGFDTPEDAQEFAKTRNAEKSEVYFLTNEAKKEKIANDWVRDQTSLEIKLSPSDLKPGLVVHPYSDFEKSYTIDKVTSILVSFENGKMWNVKTLCDLFYARNSQ